ncbi:MAG TPA: HEAT repeat domain-containing protein [Candidatus Acidoferrum sp.]|nr:HEAT repeat domain-containing protein [Candidatus Acidoferrum sp.]
MAQPSKAGTIFLTLFALPFLGAGLFFLFAIFTSWGKSPSNNPIFGVAIATFFVFIGGGLIFASFKGYGLLKQKAALEDANPSSPWLWRTDWAARRAESQSQKSYIGAWILAALGNLFLFPFMFGMVPMLARQRNPVVIFVLLFCSLGVFLLVRAVRATIRHDRYGNSYFEFDSLPFSPGERLRGRIHLRFETQAAHGIDLRLSCVRRVVTGYGKNRSTSNITLWQADKNVPSGAVGPGPLGRAIPVDFELPAEAVNTNHNNPSDQILWLLHAGADVPGVDYSDDFELPVFRTASSPQPSSAFSAEPTLTSPAFGFATARSIDGDSGSVPQPARTKVVVSRREGGTEFYFPALRTPGRAVLLLLAALIFGGAVFALLHSRVPILFSGFFILADLFLIYGFFHVTFGSARIFASNGEICSRRSLFGIGQERRIPFSEIASIVAIASLQQGGNSDNTVHSIRMLTKSGKKITLADEISNRQETRWVVSQLETLAGLKLDTHVEIDLPLGVSSQPQPSRTSFDVGAPRVFGTSQTSVAGLIALAVFLATFAGFFVLTGRSFFSSSRARNSRTTSAASRPNPAAPRVFPGPLSDADVARLLSSPAQVQAEELLERAIGHDERAIQLLDQNAGEWTSRIRETDRMKQLERRSEFSRDLRVRLANADVNLALEGWHKNSEAADLLIERARTDQRYRSAAVYFLGMLAGRGVGYDRIHGVLLDYARNDKDPLVRQWAVEGLRFLGKDEVLDELFTSFTEDPSMKVRERAGCNISDCGIFTRKQRFRMIPQLLDLAVRTDTSAQMRNWCFMALSEITDENVPPDAAAWNRWYAEHGADKLAAFERLLWYQVRGDE